jgi:5-methylcytosine-specific restriction enzyme subunit McrC
MCQGAHRRYAEKRGSSREALHLRHEIRRHKRGGIIEHCPTGSGTRGIHREYECIRSDLASPRGPIDFTRYARIAHRAQAALPCVHHPRTEDTLLNRVLLAGLTRASALASDPELKSHVRRLSKMLGATVTAQALDAPMVAAAWGAMDRRTTAYRAAFTLIDLLLEGEGVALDDQGSRIRLKGFLFDMNRFFQSLISRLLREHLTDVVVHDEFRLKGMFSYLSGQNPLGRRGPTLRPDFVVMRHGQVLSVLDAKYRDLWEQALPRDMLYQLALYALGRPAGERSSVILFPTVDAAAREQTIGVTYVARRTSEQSSRHLCQESPSGIQHRSSSPPRLLVSLRRS